MNIESTRLRHDAAVPAIDALDIHRPRSSGVLTSVQVDWCRRNGIDLAFDPMQCGWIAMGCPDDLATRADNDRGLVSDTLTFRPWTQEDAPAYARMLSAERLWDYLPESYSGPIDTVTAAALIELGRESYHSVSAVECSGTPVGQARLRFEKDGAAEVSYWLGEEYWGNGYGSRLVADYCQKAFLDHPEIDSLFARVHSDHAASQRILEKAGFVHVSDEGDWRVLERWRHG